MAPSGYSALPNPRSQPDDDRELNEAFESDGEEYDELHHTESTPFIVSETSPYDERPSTTPPATRAAYDFERDYDHPPPGSPPGPSPFAFPNNWGNSNGLTGSTPIRPSFSRPSLLRRVIGNVLPQYYASVPSEPVVTRAVGGGTDNDGVFANVMAKPSRAVQILGENGEVHLVPEETQAEAPPTYREAQMDAVPQYWETTVHAPLNTDPNADMIVEDLPTGSFILFIANTFISFFFGFVGFLLTYLLHTSHAAKYGSRAGLGMTLIQYGIAAKNNPLMEEPEDLRGIYINQTTGLLEMGPRPPPPPPPVHNLGQNETAVDITNELQTTHDWASLMLMTMGWMLLLMSIVGYYRVKRWEMSIRASTRSAAPAAVPDTSTSVSEPVYLFSADDFVSADEMEADENALRREQLAHAHAIVETA
ncbi:hypothetical protein EUX98_g2482 [Antrodiella citrinella]|uniref:Metal homeostatis protein BSD2 n=1 Tax=Antrodiella citrinella TaxID=2447956 RepID=A0A4S4MYX6_9APHY|nr:hypothetical protein EUX98_g2482 [Antrodiella citrinella]